MGGQNLNVKTADRLNTNFFRMPCQPNFVCARRSAVALPLGRERFGLRLGNILYSRLLRQESFRPPEEREARGAVSHQRPEFRRLEETEAKAEASHQRPEVYLHYICHYRFRAVG